MAWCNRIPAMLAFVEAFLVTGAVFLRRVPFLPLLQYSKAVRKATPDFPQDWPRAVDHHAHEPEHDLVRHGPGLDVEFPLMFPAHRARSRTRACDRVLPTAQAGRGRWPESTQVSLCQRSIHENSP